MKRIIDFLLVLLLLATIGFVIYVSSHDGSGVAQAQLASSTSLPPVAALVQADPFSVAPAPLISTATLPPASVTVPTRTATAKATPTGIPTLTSTATPTSTATITSTPAPTQSLLDVEIAHAIEQGNKIIKAIEDYHSAFGSYPPDLTVLVPHYLAEIPVTANGRPFFYRLFDAASPLASEVYWLAFKPETRDHVTCTYLRRLDYWDCDYNSP